MAANAPVDLEAQYDNRANVPEHPAIMAGWERDAGSYREARKHRADLAVRYGAHPRQTVDVLHPDEAEPGAPMVAFIHGGYWRSLDPSLFSHLAAGANAHGLMVAMPGYRLCPEVGIADAIEDVRAACRFLQARYRRPLVACGHSAGGHLAAALVATEWRDTGPQPPGALVSHGLAISGIFDLAPLLETSVNQSLQLDTAGAERVSPALWTAPRHARMEAWVGDAETPEYHRQSRLLVDRWSANGAQARFEVIEGANHFTAPAPLADANSRLTQALVALCRAPALQA